MITYEIEFYYYNGLIIGIESPVHVLRLTSISGKLLADTSQMWVSHLVPRGSSEIDKPSEKQSTYYELRTPYISGLADPRKFFDT